MVKTPLRGPKSRYLRGRDDLYHDIVNFRIFASEVVSAYQRLPPSGNSASGIVFVLSETGPAGISASEIVLVPKRGSLARILASEIIFVPK